MEHDRDAATAADGDAFGRPRLVGSRCRLAPLEPSDLPKTLAWRRDPELRRRLLGHRFPVSEADEARWLEGMSAFSQDRAAFAIRPPAAAGMLGYCSLSGIDWVCRTAEVGVVVGDAAARGTGVGREATALLVRYAFDDLGLGRVWARVAAANAAALRMFRGLGFRDEGLLRAHAMVAGRPMDVALLGLLSDERDGIDGALDG
jgi:RimJ/RimL family protein N-acetyltransferase